MVVMKVLVKNAAPLEVANYLQDKGWEMVFAHCDDGISEELWALDERYEELDERSYRWYEATVLELLRREL